VQLFRAVPASRLLNGSVEFRRQSSVRIPTNVPYVVDNLWESLRPKTMPSRRHAVYASPSAELALQNASAPLEEGDEYVACRVLVDQARVRVAHLEVTDARYHSDIILISKWISRHAQELMELSQGLRQKIAPLFIPGLDRAEMTSLWREHAWAAELCTYVRQHSTFWASASSTPQPSNGELFFELKSDSDTYQLEAV